MNRNKLYKEKNKSPIYVPRFVIVVKRIKEDFNNQVWPVLLFLVCEKRREKVIDELVEFIY